jgi:hypothetical protein
LRPLDRELKTLRRTVVLEGWVNRFCGQVLREIGETYREMLSEMLSYALEHSASQSTLHRTFYHGFRDRYHWLPTRIIKGFCREYALRRAKSFKKMKKRRQAEKDRPEIRSITITYSDSQNWRMGEGYVEVRTHRV